MNNHKAELHKASNESIEATREVLKTSLASIEKLTKINLEASKKFLNETTKVLKEMSLVKNPKELFERVSQLATHTVQSNVSNCRDVYDVITDAQQRIQKMMESHIQTAQKNMANAADSFSKLNVGTKSAFSADAIKKWFEGTNEALEHLNKIAAKAAGELNRSSTTATKANNTTKPAAKAETKSKTTVKSASARKTSAARKTEKK